MIYPIPVPGLVIRFSFLWSEEARVGAREGRKDRPCAIVVATPHLTLGDTRVVVVPITHSKPDDPASSIEVPQAVRLALGLDTDLSWVRLNELNVFSWPGYDLRPLPGTGRVEYGAIPEQLFERIRRGILALDRARKVQKINRD